MANLSVDLGHKLAWNTGGIIISTTKVRLSGPLSYTEYLKRLADAAGLGTSDEAALRRLDRCRKKKGSLEWVNPHDPEAQITRMKDGRTALAYKDEHAVDMDTGAIVWR